MRCTTFLLGAILASASVINDCSNLKLQVFWLQDSTVWNHSYTQKMVASKTRVIQEVIDAMKDFKHGDTTARISEVNVAFGQYADKGGPVTGAMKSPDNSDHVGTVLTDEWKFDYTPWELAHFSVDYFYPWPTVGKYNPETLIEGWHYQVWNATLLDDKPYIWVQPFTSNHSDADVFNRTIKAPAMYAAHDFSEFPRGNLTYRHFVPQQGGDYQNNQWEANLWAISDPYMRIGWAYDEPNTIRAIVNVTASFSHKDIESCDFKNPDTMSAEQKLTCQPPNYNAEFHPLFIMGPHSYGQPWCREDRSVMPVNRDNVEIDEPLISNKDSFVCNDPWSQHPDYIAPPRQDVYPWGSAGPSTGSMNSLKSIRHYLDLYLHADAYPNYLYATADYDMRRLMVQHSTCCSGVDAWYRGSNHFLMECQTGIERNPIYSNWAPTLRSREIELDHNGTTVDFSLDRDWFTFFPESEYAPLSITEFDQIDCRMCSFHGGIHQGSLARYSTPWNMKSERCCWMDDQSSPIRGRWNLNTCPSHDQYTPWLTPDEVLTLGKYVDLPERVHFGDISLRNVDKYTTHHLDVLANNEIQHQYDRYNVEPWNKIDPFHYDEMDPSQYYSANQSNNDISQHDHGVRGSIEWWKPQWALLYHYMKTLQAPMLGIRDHLPHLGPQMTSIPDHQLPYNAEGYYNRQLEYPNPYDARYADLFVKHDVHLVQISVSPNGNWSDYVTGSLPYTRQKEDDPWTAGIDGGYHDNSSTHQLDDAVADWFVDRKVVFEANRSGPSGAYVKRDYYSRNEGGPEDANWLGVPALLAAAHSCPNLKNDPFTIYSCTRKIDAELCSKKLPSGSTYATFQNTAAIDKCHAMVGKPLGGCRKDPYSTEYPAHRKGFKYNDIFETQMLWKQHDAPTQHNTTDTQWWPSEAVMRGAQYCTSTGEPSDDPWGNPCPADLCSCENEITNFDITQPDFFRTKDLNPLYNRALQRQWWSECFDNEYSKPIATMNQHAQATAGRYKVIARHGHVSNYSDRKTGHNDEEIIFRLRDEIVKQLSATIVDLVECNPNLIVSTESPESSTDDSLETSTTEAPGATTENIGAVVTPIMTSTVIVGIVAATWASCFNLRPPAIALKQYAGINMANVENFKQE